MTLNKALDFIVNKSDSVIVTLTYNNKTLGSTFVKGEGFEPLELIARTIKIMAKDCGVSAISLYAMVGDFIGDEEENDED